MAQIHISGGDSITSDEAAQHIRNYSASVQELAEAETPEEQDRSPITDADRERLDKATETTFQSPFDSDAVVRDRAPEFTPPSAWISPVVKHRQKQAMRLPSAASIEDLDKRISHVMKFDGTPKPVAALAQKARDAVSAAREAHESARHPENRIFSVSVAAKDEAVKAIGVATAAVGAMEDLANDSIDEWFDGLTANLDKKRADALKALRAAERAYADFRGTVDTAQALAVANGLWSKDWHSSVVSQMDLNTPISAMRDAISYLDEDSDKASDYTTAEYLTTDYEGIPPHTLEKLRFNAEVSQPGSFAAQVYARALNPHRNDVDALEAIETKNLVLLTNSSPLTTDLIGKQD